MYTHTHTYIYIYPSAPYIIYIYLYSFSLDIYTLVPPSYTHSMTSLTLYDVTNPL